MRVCLVSPYSLSLPGGVQRQVLGLAASLREAGVDAQVLAPCDGPPPVPYAASVGPSTGVVTNGSISPIAAGREAASRTLAALRALAPDVLHLHEPLVPGPTTAALVGTEIPAVGTFHATMARPHLPYRLLRRPATGAARQLTIRTAVSESARATAQEVLGGTYRVLPNGVDVAHFAKAVPWSTGPAPGPPAVFFVGRHEPRKGLGVLLEAWEGLDRDAVLWVASDGPETETLRARGVARVEWVGRVDEEEKARRLRAATLFCAPALGGESFGVVLLEAMAAGTAIVATDIPGYRNVARPGLEAIGAPPGDAAALRDALRAGLDGAARRAELVRAGEQRVAGFSMTRLAERYVPIYEAAIGCGR